MNAHRANGTTPEQLEADIARQRDELASTVDALHARLDVKTRAKDKAASCATGRPPTTASRQPQVLAGAAAVLAAVGGFVALRIRRSR